MPQDEGKGKGKMAADTTQTHRGAINPQSACPMFKLPIELRLDIYNIYMDSELQSPHFMAYTTTQHSLTALAGSRFYPASPPPPLALTCKIIYRDTATLFRNLFAIHVMPTRMGLRIGMGGYSRPSPREGHGLLGLRPVGARPFHGNLVLSNMTKCIIRVDDPNMEGMHSLANLFAQVVSNQERERTKSALWDADCPGIRPGRATVPMYMQHVLPPPPSGKLPSAAIGLWTCGRRDGEPSRGNGLGKAAEGVRELVFDWAPIETPSWWNRSPEGPKETRAQQEKKIQEKFWDLVVGMDSLVVLKLKGDCPGWWKGYLEAKMKEKMKDKIMEKMIDEIMEKTKDKTREETRENVKGKIEQEMKEDLEMRMEQEIKEGGFRIVMCS